MEKENAKLHNVYILHILSKVCKSPSCCNCLFDQILFLIFEMAWGIGYFLSLPFCFLCVRYFKQKFVFCTKRLEEKSIKTKNQNLKVLCKATAC